MTWVHRFLALSLGAASLLGCSSEPLDDDPTGDGGGGSQPPPVYMGSCQAALRQTIGLVEASSAAEVVIVEEAAGERLLYIDASAGGFGMEDETPWVYVSLESGARVDLTDVEALESAAWDLAFERFLVRTNSADSGPGRGGALRVALPFESVDASTLGNRELPADVWFDEECNLTLDDSGAPVTTFSGWSEYDQATHVLSPAAVTFLVSGGTGKLFKVAIVDYYGTKTGASGNTAGRYLLRVAPLE